MAESVPTGVGPAPPGENRRSFLSGLGMVAGLVSGYGALAALARFERRDPVRLLGVRAEFAESG